MLLFTKRGKLNCIMQYDTDEHREGFQAHLGLRDLVCTEGAVLNIGPEVLPSKRGVHQIQLAVVSRLRGITGTDEPRRHVLPESWYVFVGDAEKQMKIPKKEGVYVKQSFSIGW